MDRSAENMVTPTSPHLNVWVIILNWNGLHDTLRCLQSLATLQVSGADVHTLVIDNGSVVDPRPTIAAHFPRVETLRLATNTGFANGCNVGIAFALEQGADHILLLNNDTVVHSQFLEHLLAYSTAHPQAGIIGPSICRSDMPEVVAFAGAKINFALADFAHRHAGSSYQQLPRDPIVADYVTGCCMLISRAVVTTVGLLDDQLFAYFEDVDYCVRARRHGFAPVCLPQSLIWHDESSSTRRDLSAGTTSPMKHYLMARNRIITIKKHASLAEFTFFILVTNTFIAVWYLLAFTLKQRWTKMVWFCLGLTHGLQYCLSGRYKSLVWRSR